MFQGPRSLWHATSKRAVRCAPTISGGALFWQATPLDSAQAKVQIRRAEHAVRVLVVRLNPMNPGGDGDRDAFGRPEGARDTRFGVVAGATVVRTVAPDREVIGIAFVGNEVLAAPEQQVPSPSGTLRRRAAEKPRARAAAIWRLTIGNEP